MKRYAKQLFEVTRSRGAWWKYATQTKQTNIAISTVLRESHREMADSCADCNGMYASDDGVNGHYEWIVGNIINGRNTSNGRGHACMVLNREIRIPPQIVLELWQNAIIRCTVDGGTNRWRQFLKLQSPEAHDLKPPDLITGDFDSITDETNKFFDAPTIRRVHTPDQNATDFTKAVNIVHPLLTAQQCHDIVVLHDMSGRFDHIMANINTLHKKQSDTLNIFLLSRNSLTWLLRPGKHFIRVPQDLVQQQRWCALLPIGAPAHNVTTTGLKWNLTNGTLAFGGLVSTSNTYAATMVNIETNTCLVWSMGMFSFEDD